MTDIDTARGDPRDMQDTRDLRDFANPGKGQQPTGHSLVRPTSGISERVVGAQPVAVYRDRQRILQNLKFIASAAGTDFFYRFPVKKKDGGADWIEGPSIKLANAVHLEVGNCVLETREVDVGDAWVFYARETDLEGGSSMERAYRQRKSQTSMKTKDADRQQDIAYQIGQSKAIRNVICNFLQVYCDYAFEQARDSLVEKIGKDLPGWRARTVEGLSKMPVELSRVERVMGRTAKEWLAPQIAQVIAMMKSVADGMAAVDEVFPPAVEVASPPRTGGGEADRAAGPADPMTAGAGGSQTEAPAEAEKTPEDIAYERGVEAKAAGSTRRALPGEYRDETRTREALAWTAGLEGAPKP